MILSQKNIIYLEEYLPYLMGRNIIANIKSERVEKMFVEMKNNWPQIQNIFSWIVALA